jgi:signal transduction histidine kinase
MAVLAVDLPDLDRGEPRAAAESQDEAGRLVGSQLGGAVRLADAVRRCGPREFLILLTDLSSESDASLIANRLSAAFEASRRAALAQAVGRVEIGLGVYPDDGDDIDALIAVANDGIDGRLLVREKATVNPDLALAALKALKAQAVAEERNRRLKRLMAIVAHDLRGPLAPIRAAAAMLTRVPAHELGRLQSIIEKQVAQASHLVDDLLDVSRIDIGKMRLDRCDIDLAAIVLDAVDACRPAMEARSQRLALNLPPDPVAACVDPGRVTQVVVNLLDNASKYTPEGGAVALEMTVVDDVALLVVSDDGIGITSEALPHVFESFLQDAHAERFDASGLGLGLSVVRELVEAHGGTVVAWSAGPGLGSRFIVRLPLARLAPEEFAQSIGIGADADRPLSVG